MYPNYIDFSINLVHSTSYIIMKIEYLFIFKRLVSITDLCNYEKINNFNIAICCGIISFPA